MLPPRALPQAKFGATNVIVVMFMTTKEWQALDRPALKAEIEKKQQARAESQTRIQKLNKERENYLARERKRLVETEKSDSFDDRVAQTIRDQAARKGIA